jgi:hypothetical protein
MRVVIDLLGAPIEFSERLSGGAHPLLDDVGTLHESARTGNQYGIGVDESPNLAVRILNADNEGARILGRPLRAAATVYDDEEALFFEGIVSSMKLGRVIELTIEA